MRDLAHERRRHRRNARQQDAEDGAGRLYVGIGAVRRQRRAESPYKIEQGDAISIGEREFAPKDPAESIQVFSNRG